MLTALDEYARLAPVLLDPVCTTAPAGSIKCIYHPPTTPRSARLMTGVSAQSCSLRYGPSSEDLCALIYHLCSTAQLAVYQCPFIGRLRASSPPLAKRVGSATERCLRVSLRASDVFDLRLVGVLLWSGGNTGMCVQANGIVRHQIRAALCIFEHGWGGHATVWVWC